MHALGFVDQAAGLEVKVDIARPNVDNSYFFPLSETDCLVSSGQ